MSPLYACFLVSLLSCAVFLFSSCTRQNTEPIRVPRDLSVMKDASDCVAIGPRFSGSTGAKKTADWIAGRIRSMGRIPVVDEFTDQTPLGPVVFRNVIADVPGQKKDFVVIGAHYDTKFFSAEMNFDGANDGASGVAALLAMIRALNDKTPPIGIKFIFFDGEEARFSYSEKDGLHGSRHAAEQLLSSGKLSRCRAMILLDMIGDRDLCMALPADTPEYLQGIAYVAAANIHASEKLSRSSSSMLDDHVPFRDAGVPAIDLIDFQFGPGNAYWHTSQDTLDKISAESICTAADLALEMVRLIAMEDLP